VERELRAPRSSGSAGDQPYLGFLTGWFMVVAYILGRSPRSFARAIDSRRVWLRQYQSLGVGRHQQHRRRHLLVIAVVGIASPRVPGHRLDQYLILIRLSIWGLIAVINHHPGTFPITSGWFSPTGIGGKGSAVVKLPYRHVRLYGAGTAPCTSMRK
jgi:hypothetical protein